MAIQCWCSSAFATGGCLPGTTPVVVGFDDVQRQVILRSGTEKRRIVSYRHFSNTWQKGNQWGFVALTPGALPATPDAGRYLDAVINAESHLTTDQSIAAYRAAVARWPENTAALFGLGNMQYRDGQQGAAELSWQKILQRQSNHAGAANNLAELLAEKGDIEQAIALLETTLAGRPGARKLEASAPRNPPKVKAAITGDLKQENNPKYQIEVSAKWEVVKPGPLF